MFRWFWKWYYKPLRDAVVANDRVAFLKAGGSVSEWEFINSKVKR